MAIIPNDNRLVHSVNTVRRMKVWLRRDPVCKRSEIRGAAVHVDRLAGDGGGLVGAQEQRGARDLVGGLAASLKDRIQEAGELVLPAHVEALCERGAAVLGHYGF